MNEYEDQCKYQNRVCFKLECYLTSAGYGRRQRCAVTLYSHHLGLFCTLCSHYCKISATVLDLLPT